MSNATLRAALLPLLFAALASGRAPAQTVPATINYQGRLTDNTPAQTPVNATVNMTFEIWDAPSAGTRLWFEPSTGAASIVVTNGVFNVLLGASAGGNSVPIPASLFSGGTARYLQIIAGGETLAPRQTISATGYANQAQNAATAATAANAAQLGGVAPSGYQPAMNASCPGGYFFSAINSGGVLTCTTPPANNLTPPVLLSGSLSGPLLTASNSGAAGAIGLQGTVTDTSSANTYGVWGEAAASNGRGVIGRATAAGGVTYGVAGQADSVSGIGVRGIATASSGSNYGVYGSSPSASGYGVYGTSTAGSGVVGNTSATSGLVYGVYGQTFSTTSQAAGVYGANGATSGTTVGIYGVATASASGTGAVGKGKETGGFFEATAAAGATGVIGQSDATDATAIGVSGSVAGAGDGVYGLSVSGPGVHGVSTSSNGVYASSTNGIGLYAISTNGSGLFGVTSSTSAGFAGVYGHLTATSPGGFAAGVRGDSDGTGTNGIGVYGTHAGSGPGVYGSSVGGTGVHGTSTSGIGVRGISSSGAGVYGSSTTGAAGNFQGDVIVSGKLEVDTLGAAGATALCRNSVNVISTCSSSLRYKTDIAPFTGGLDLLARLRPIAFTWKTQPLRDLGFGAEEVAAVEPLLVTHNAAGEVEGVKYDRLTAVLTNAVMQQQREIDALKAIVCADHPGAEVCAVK